jgi:hypothetical protein
MIFRASYSVLSAWSKGNWEDAIKMYYKIPLPIFQAQSEGKEWHKRWANYIEKTGMLPIQFDSKKLSYPICESKMVVKLADWLNLVGVIDCYDAEGTIYEFKTGSTSSTNSMYERQAGVYGVLAKMSGIRVDKCHIMQYNQHTKESETTIVWLTEKVLQDTLDWIETNSSEMFNYIQENKLEEKLRNDRSRDKNTDLEI